MFDFKKLASFLVGKNPRAAVPSIVLTDEEKLSGAKKMGAELISGLQELQDRPGSKFKFVAQELGDQIWVKTNIDCFDRDWADRTKGHIYLYHDEVASNFGQGDERASAVVTLERVKQMAALRGLVV